MQNIKYVWLLLFIFELSCSRSLFLHPCQKDLDCPKGLLCFSKRCVALYPSQKEAEKCPLGKQRFCYEAAPRTLHSGSCRAGTQTCQASGYWSACKGQVRPSEEICGDQVDNNCNGEVNEGCFCNWKFHRKIPISWRWRWRCSLRMFAVDKRFILTNGESDKNGKCLYQNVRLWDLEQTFPSQKTRHPATKLIKTIPFSKDIFIPTVDYRKWIIRTFISNNADLYNFSEALQILVWDAVKNQKHASFTLGFKSGKIGSSGFSSEGNWIYLKKHSTDHVHVWSMRNKKLQFVAKTKEGRSGRIWFTPDERYLVVYGQDLKLRFWSLTNGKLIHEMNVPSKPLFPHLPSAVKIRWHPFLPIFIFINTFSINKFPSEKTTWTLWRYPDGEWFKLPQPKETIVDIGFHPNGRHLYYTTDRIRVPRQGYVPAPVYGFDLKTQKQYILSDLRDDPIKKRSLHFYSIRQDGKYILEETGIWKCVPNK